MAQEKLKTMLMQNFGATNKEHYGMLWYFLDWSIVFDCHHRALADTHLVKTFGTHAFHFHGHV